MSHTVRPHTAIGRRAARSAAVLSATIVALGLGTAPAFAANITVNNGNGTMTHIDDGDRFRVCDTRVNGVGVTGTLGWTVPGVQTRIVKTIQDGGDKGCDYFTYDVNDDLLWFISICDTGASSGCDNKFFRE
ncbi:hypothetical protein [Nocardioides litoris]|uniref:hypothetical protein n=1 Tax=Nocardioides litoris TaxID=1926648 RepID=UPI00111F2666|nr:hypothetical protein [Nocardioides litoris]